VRTAALLVLAASSVASADPKPDRAVGSAGNANLESEAHRKGIVLQAGLGGGLVLGFGIAGVVGNGASGSFRLGRVATENSLVTLELDLVTPRHAVAAMMNSDTYTDQSATFMLGGQFYLNQAAWVRLAGGLGVYHGDHRDMGIADVDLIGPAGAFGAGLEVVRFAHWALGLEMFTVGMINKDGLMSSTGFLIDAILY
jgi:hypothetical protein